MSAERIDASVAEPRGLDNADPPENTCDAFLGGRLMVRQPRHGYRAGLDAVLLAASIPEASGKAGPLLDCGSGVGMVALAAASRITKLRCTGVEIAPAYVALATANAAANDLSDRVKFLAGDVTQPHAGLEAASFAVVVMNPPYHDAATSRGSPQALRHVAHTMPAGALADWLRAAARYAAPDGQLLVIHRADALGDLLAGLAGRFGAGEVWPLYPREGVPAKRILLRARKGSRAPLSVRPGIVLHGDDGAFLPAIDAVLREGAALDLP